MILTALKKYGMILADNGSDWFITGAPDKRWDDEVLNTLKKVKGRDFEVVKMGSRGDEVAWFPPAWMRQANVMGGPLRRSSAGQRHPYTRLTRIS